MHFFTGCLVVLVAVIGSSSSLIFDSLFQPRSGCTVLVDVPLTPYDPYFKPEYFPSLDAKLAANQNRFDRNLRQVWVDAPDPSICGYATFRIGGRCCLNGHFGTQYEWNDFRSGDAKKQANEQLWAQSQGLPSYKVWADAPERYCKRRYGGLADFFG